MHPKPQALTRAEKLNHNIFQNRTRNKFSIQTLHISPAIVFPRCSKHAIQSGIIVPRATFVPRLFWLLWLEIFPISAGTHEYQITIIK
jgi:hypothetical protein